MQDIEQNHRLSFKGATIELPEPIEGQTHWDIPGVGVFDLEGNPVEAAVKDEEPLFFGQLESVEFQPGHIEDKPDE